MDAAFYRYCKKNPLPVCHIEPISENDLMDFSDYKGIAYKDVPSGFAEWGEDLADPSQQMSRFLRYWRQRDDYVGGRVPSKQKWTNTWVNHNRSIDSTRKS